jgi:hypothetical protein
LKVFKWVNAYSFYHGFTPLKSMLKKMSRDIGQTQKNVSKATRGIEKASRMARVLGRLFKDVRGARKVLIYNR